MDFLLPLGLFVIMFALGATLRIEDFRRALGRPVALILGLVAQVVLLPLTAFVLARITGLAPEFAVGLMLLAACPGGVMAGAVTHLARGETALTITLSALTSVLVVVTLPLVVGWSVHHFLGEQVHVQVPVGQLMGGLLLVTVLPVALGLWLRETERITPRAHKVIRGASGMAFALMVLYAFLVQGPAMARHLPTIGLVCLSLNVLTMATGAGLAAAAGLDTRARVALTMECGFQNSALGITLATGLIAQPALAVPSAVYSVLMYATALAVITWRRFARPAPGP